MNVNFLSIGFLGLAVLGIIAVIVAVVVLGARDRVRKRALIVVAALVAMAVAGLSLLSVGSRARPRAVVVPPAPAGELRDIVLNAQIENGNAVSVSESLTTAEIPEVEVRTGKSRDIGFPDGGFDDIDLAALAQESSVNPWVKKAMTLAALAVMVALAYVFVDAGRRGRYTWPLRVGSAAAFAVLCAVLARLGPMM